MEDTNQFESLRVSQLDARELDKSIVDVIIEQVLCTEQQQQQQQH